MIPFLKWAGGKRWLFDREFVRCLPAFDRYVEPFLGGGAGFFATNPPSALLSDINSELIELYEVVRDRPALLRAKLMEHGARHTEQYYYDVRRAAISTKIDRAARFLYLNRTCWNGLYRLNKAGMFNVPIGTKDSVVLATDDFKTASIRLKRAKIVCCDFENTIDQAGAHDLIFVDPPYTVQHNMNGFVKYNEKIFSWSDQVRLKNALSRAKDRGASIIITNADHSSVRELYKGFGLHQPVRRSSVISGHPRGRSSVTELVIIG